MTDRSTTDSTEPVEGSDRGTEAVGCPPPEEVRPIHARFWRALNDEVQAVRAQDKRRAGAVHSGQQIDDSPGCYRFAIETTSHGLSAGDRIVARLGEMELEGRVIEAENGVTLDLGQLISPPIPSGHVRPDTAWLTAAIRDRIADTIQALQRDRTPDPEFNFDLALRVLGEGEPRTLENGPSGQGGSGAEMALNHEQREVVARSFETDVLYVWGPPGTGKSTTLGASVAEHARSGNSVLVVAASNQAVDVATEKIAQCLAPERLEQGELVRVGPGVTPHLSVDLGRYVRPDQRVRCEDARQEDERDRLEKLTRRAKGGRVTLLRPIRDGLVDLLAPILPDAAQHQLESPVRRHRRALSKLKDTRAPSASEIVSEARVVVTTAHQALLSPTRTDLFDTVVIDEASALSLPAVYLMAGRASEHAIVFGDFQQLPPVTAGKDRHGVLGRDVFQHIGIPDAVDRGEEPASLVTLRKQYRMGPQICRLVSRIFYDNRLRTAEQVRKRKAPDSPLGRESLYCLNTSPFNPRVRRTDDGSRENPTHARITEGVLDYLLLGPDRRPDASAGPAAVLTPFVGQRELIKRRVRDRYPSDQVPVSTVHGAQGDEYGVVVLDLVDARRGLPVSTYLQADTLTATGARLLNVGLTRARDQLIVVGDFRYLARRGGRVTKALMRTLGSEATRVEAPYIMRGSRAKGA